MDTILKHRIGIPLVVLSSLYALLALVALTEKLTEAFRNGYTVMAPDSAVIVHAAGAVGLVAAVGGWLLVRGGTRLLRLWSLSTLGVCLLCFGAWVVIHGWAADTRRSTFEIKRNL